MKSAPIRLTKYESGVLLSYINNNIESIQNQINNAQYEGLEKEFVENLHLTEIMLASLKMKLETCYNKCAYQMPYSKRKEKK